MIYNQNMYALGSRGSVIREIYEYGRQRKVIVGEDNVFDFSLGNPSVPSPAIVSETLIHLLSESDSVKLHGYTSSAGDRQARTAIADYLNNTYQANVSGEQIYMTVGAAASLTISLTALLNPGDEVIVFAPYFPEYRVFAEKAGGVIKVVCNHPDDFQIDFEALKRAITEKTKALIINSPNNPSGTVLTKETLCKLSAFLLEKQNEYGHSIFIISDEPYRELVYDGAEVPCMMNLYENTIVCYSFSKSLSLPGERIGYILVSPKIPAWKELFSAVCGAGRALGFVCAPSLFQHMIVSCLGQTSDINIYNTNRKLLYEALVSYGFRIVKPDGAFYMFLKAPGNDANAFCKCAAKFELLLVPSDDFGMPGYVRIAYCVSTEQIARSLPAFLKLAKEYNLYGKQ